MISGVIAATAAAKTFGDDKPNFYRESSSGMNLFAYFLARNIYDLWNAVRNTFIFLACYFVMADPPGNAAIWFADTFLIIFCCYGVTYVITILLSREMGQVISVIIAGKRIGMFGVLIDQVSWSVTSGLSPSVATVEQASYGPLQFFWWISYARWGAEALYLHVVSEWKHMDIERTIIQDGFRTGN